jgi:WhiB family redox-sensing transcriptional regulator
VTGRERGSLTDLLPAVSPGLAYAVAANAWRREAACWGSAANFYPEVNAAGHRARAACAACPARTACLVNALKQEDYGVWGGMGRKQRAAYIQAELQPRTVRVAGGWAAQAICWPKGRDRPLALRSQTFETRAAAQGAFAPVLRKARSRHDWRAAVERREAA